MNLRWLLLGALSVAFWCGDADLARAQYPNYTPFPNQQYQALNRFYYYPFNYFPHSYWPAQGPKWPEPVGAPYRPAPAYMAYPPFKEPNWRYEYFEAQRFHRGFHFWLDQF